MRDLTEVHRPIHALAMHDHQAVGRATAMHVPRRQRWGELIVQSNHTFLGGASHPEELVREAARLGHEALALTDVETVGGAVRAHVAAADVRREGRSLRLAHGARMRFSIAGDRAELEAELAARSPLPRSPGRAAPRDRQAMGSLEPATAQCELVLYPTCRASWGLLCRMLSHRVDTHGIGHAQGAPARAPRTRLVHELVEMLHDHPGGRGMLAVIVPPPLPSQRFLEAAQGIAAALRCGGSRRSDARLAVAMSRVDDAECALLADRACVLAEVLGVPVAASNDIRMHHASRRALLDTLTSIRTGVPLHRAHHLVAPNAERRLKRADDALLRYGDRPEALETAWMLLERASDFSLDALRYEYPDEVVPRDLTAAGWTAMEYLRSLAWKGARERYPRGIPQKVARQMEHEFAIIADLGYAPYFLTVHEIVVFARSRGILCQGRGAAANSAVCFALGITAVDPDRIDVLFERFVSRERNEPPDIDIDFEHERREEVIQHIYARYGRERAALVCEVISYRGRSAVRDVGKALGFAPDAVERLAREVDRWGGGGLGTRDELGEDGMAGSAAGSSPSEAPSGPLAGRAAERMRTAGLNPAAPLVARYAHLVDEILGFPRHRSQHVGGFVISRHPLIETVPVAHAAMQDRTIIEWDKDDIEALGMLKIDVLALGMLTAVRKAIGMVNSDHAALAAGGSPFRAPDAPAVRSDLADISPPARGIRDGTAASGSAEATEPLQFHTIPPEDPATYAMVCRADTVGVFQIESRAQMSMLPRLRPRCFYDLVIEVAIVRPGPIQGDMVHPYLRRRNGEEPIAYPDDAIRKVLGKTLGVPLFQEQAMALAVVAAGFTPGQADELRRAIAAWKRQGNRIAQFGQALESGMMARGYARAFARQVFEQIKGFSGYGFPESHAASFALLVYASAWLKRHHPAAFAAALLNSQPMGFYAPAQIIRDARDHGVAVREVDIHCSQWDTVLERGDDIARTLMGDATRPSAQSERSCRRTQRQVDEAFLRMRVRYPAMRIATDGRIEHWHGRWSAVVLPDPAQDSRPSATSRSPDGPSDPSRFTVPSQPAVRLGLRMVRGLDVEEAHRIMAAMSRHGVFRTLADLQAASGVSATTLRRLASADAFQSMGLDRQQATWQILALRDKPRLRPLWEKATREIVPRSKTRDGHASQGGLWDSAADQVSADEPPPTAAVPDPVSDSLADPPVDSPSDSPSDPPMDIEPALPAIDELSGITRDLEATGVSLKRHPMACIRARLAKARIVPCSWLRDAPRTPAGRILTVAGLVLVRQRPSTAKGIVFMTIEDETGVANLILRPQVYARLRQQVRHAVAICVRGKVERRDGVVHVLVANARDIGAALTRGSDAVSAQSRDFH